MATDDFVMKRPGFIKYLDVSAVEQSRKPNPLRSASILIFHNEIELFLQLASEYLDASQKKKSQSLWIIGI
jgi:hypothetical protein